MGAVGREVLVSDPACVQDHAGDPAASGDGPAEMLMPCPAVLELNIPVLSILKGEW